MHFCTVNVAIGGDQRNIMNRSYFEPVSWPEVQVLRAVHGDDAIDAIIPFVEVNQSARAERDRLAAIYGDEVLGMLWGGKNAPNELSAPGVRQKPGIIWRNPLSGLHEQTTATSSEPYTFPPEERKVAEIVGNYAVRNDAVAAKSESDRYVDEEEDFVLPPAADIEAAAEPESPAKRPRAR